MLSKKAIWLTMLAGLVFNLFFPKQAYIGSFFIVMGGVLLLSWKRQELKNYIFRFGHG